MCAWLACPAEHMRVQVPEGDGALAVHVLPRYVLRNLSGLALQYKQQDTHAERTLGQGGFSALLWPDGSLPLRLCVRVHEAGALWSGAMSLDTPGDAFVKLRHKYAPCCCWRCACAAQGSHEPCRLLLPHNQRPPGPAVRPAVLAQEFTPAE